MDPHSPSSFKGQHVAAPMGTLTVLESRGSEQKDAAKKPAGQLTASRLLSRFPIPFQR